MTRPCRTWWPRVTREQGRIGVLVNNAGSAPSVRWRRRGWRKAAGSSTVEGLSDALRLELKPHGIRVSIIEPASTVTEWGRIAAEGLLASSGDGPYAAQAREMAGVLASTGRPATSTQPDVVAGAALRAATAARPRTRYPVGRGAVAITALRRLLPDRVYDLAVTAVPKRIAR
jgi:short-subunit dehydrogenase